MSIADNWGVLGGFLAWGVIALVIWASPDAASRKILVQDKWMDRTEVITQSDAIQKRANQQEAQWRNVHEQLDALQASVHSFCEDVDEGDSK
jgi:hypothetical protein